MKAGTLSMNSSPVKGNYQLLSETTNPLAHTQEDQVLVRESLSDHRDTLNERTSSGRSL